MDVTALTADLRQEWSAKHRQARGPRITTDRHHGRFIQYRPWCACRYCERTRIAYKWAEPWRWRR